jgi:hypothetical protein
MWGVGRAVRCGPHDPGDMGFHPLTPCSVRSVPMCCAQWIGGCYDEERALPLTPCLSFPSPPIRSEKRSTRHSTRFIPCCANSASHDHFAFWDRTRLGFFTKRFGNDHACPPITYMPAHCYSRKPSSSGLLSSPSPLEVMMGLVGRCHLVFGGVFFCLYSFALLFLPPFFSALHTRNIIPLFSSPFLLCSPRSPVLLSHHPISAISAHNINTSNTISDTVNNQRLLTNHPANEAKRSALHIHAHTHAYTQHTHTHYPYSPLSFDDPLFKFFPSFLLSFFTRTYYCLNGFF